MRAAAQLARLGVLGTLLSLALPLEAEAQTPLWGPKTYVRGRGQPQRVVQQFSVPSTAWEYTFVVDNGTGGANQVSAALIEINGVAVVDTTDFNQTVAQITRTVQLQVQNEIAVTLFSVPESRVTLTLFAPSTSSTISSAGGFVSLNEVATVSFPSGAFDSAQPVEVSVTHDPNVDADFGINKAIYSAGMKAPYEIHVTTGPERPAEAVSIVIQVPETFADALTANSTVVAFAALEQSSEFEAFTIFDPVGSLYSATERTLALSLPSRGFSALGRSDGLFEAVIYLASVPQVVGKTAEELRLLQVCPISIAPPIDPLPAEPSSPFGERIDPFTGQLKQHNGIDFSVPNGTQVFAGADATEALYGLSNSWGYFVLLKYDTQPCPTWQVFAHLDGTVWGPVLEVGQPQPLGPVRQGDLIAISDNSGSSTGPHLHVELKSACVPNFNDASGTYYDSWPCMQRAPLTFTEGFWQFDITYSRNVFGGYPNANSHETGTVSGFFELVGNQIAHSDVNVQGSYSVTASGVVNCAVYDPVCNYPGCYSNGWACICSCSWSHSGGASFGVVGGTAQAPHPGAGVFSESTAMSGFFNFDTKAPSNDPLELYYRIPLCGCANDHTVFLGRPGLIPFGTYPGSYSQNDQSISWTSSVILDSRGFYYPQITSDGQESYPTSSRTWHATFWRIDPPTEKTNGKSASFTLSVQSSANPIIRYRLHSEAAVELTIYDVMGRHVSTLIREPVAQGQGSHIVTWNGRNDRGQQAASGIYFVKLQAGRDVATSKFAFIR